MARELGLGPRDGQAFWLDDPGFPANAFGALSRSSASEESATRDQVSQAIISMRLT